MIDILIKLYKDLIKIISSYKEADLIILRQLKFIPTVMEIFKKVSACRKNEYSHFLQIIGVVLIHIIK